MFGIIREICFVHNFNAEKKVEQKKKLLRLTDEKRIFEVIFFLTEKIQNDYFI